jgi:CRP-like cAMP-binding protein
MPSNKKIDLAEFLSHQHLCESLTLAEVHTLIEFTELVVYGEGDVVAQIGDVGDALYFVVGGEAGLFRDHEGRPIELGRMKEGELMGEMSFFDRKPRTARLCALRHNTRLLRLTRARYNRLRVEHPFIAVNLLEHAIISLDHLFRRMSQSGASPASTAPGGV